MTPSSKKVASRPVSTTSKSELLKRTRVLRLPSKKWYECYLPERVVCEWECEMFCPCAWVSQSQQLFIENSFYAIVSTSTCRHTTAPRKMIFCPRFIFSSLVYLYIQWFSPSSFVYQWYNCLCEYFCSRCIKMLLFRFVTICYMIFRFVIYAWFYLSKRAFHDLTFGGNRLLTKGPF